MAAPGSTHYGYYIISYEFVYVGNYHVRNVLVIFALFSMLAGCVTFVSSILLVIALRKVIKLTILLISNHSFSKFICTKTIIGKLATKY